VPSFRTGTVTAILSERPGIQRVEVDGERAYVLTQLIGTVSVGDRVVMNTTAVELGLGTGGWHIVHWNLERESWSEHGPGHEMKLRYTSLQVDSGASGAAEALLDTPVVACTLHSQVAVVARAFKHVAAGRTLAYVMTDGGALPLAFSDLVADLRGDRVIDLTVTAGHAFGGDREAVNVWHAVALASEADAVVVGMGPGSLGTATRLGFSGLEVATALTAAAGLGCRPVVAVRHSVADERERHRGISHHTTTALELTPGPVFVPIPTGEPRPDVRPHRVVEVEVPPLGELTVTTMGRSASTDRSFFSYAAAAGVFAAQLLVD
jgi:hypothetical protein